ncbi:acyltransferase [Streptomyces sp. CNQ-509]|uniref:acyltransferase n=1 Tax=Streptomyces sp. CNQ-509 TaxID=444103 RepID=UPI000ACCFA42|nr:acyltransferase [Streptomyces sp. CNQ-509]
MTVSDVPTQPAAASASPPKRAAATAPAAAPDRAAAPARRPGHRYDVDLIRLLCACGVILGHTGSEFIDAVGRQEANGAAAYWAGMTADALSRFAVPMYFAIAGWAVLVGAPPRDGRRLAQRMVRIVVPMAVWTVLYLLWGKLQETNEDPLRDLAVDAAFGTVRPAYHLWYLYAYVPVVLLLGFVVLLRAGRRPWWLGAVLLGFALGPGLLADAGRVAGSGTPSFGWGFGVYSLVYAAGGALLFSLRPRSGRGVRALWLGAATAAMLGVLLYQTQVKYVIPNAHVLVAVFTGAVLLTLTRVRVPERWRSPLKRVAGAAFGAYLVHLMVIRTLAEPLVSADPGGAEAVLLTAGVWAASVVLSFGAALLWQRLGLRRLLG